LLPVGLIGDQGLLDQEYKKESHAHVLSVGTGSPPPFPASLHEQALPATLVDKLGVVAWGGGAVQRSSVGCGEAQRLWRSSVGAANLNRVRGVAKLLVGRSSAGGAVLLAGWVQRSV
jgi:hypothetical protein